MDFVKDKQFAVFLILFRKDTKKQLIHNFSNMN